MGISIGMYTPNENEKEGEVRAIYGPVLSSRFTLSVYSYPYILSLPLTTNCVCYLCLFEKLPCYLVLSALATVLTSFLDCFPSVVTSLSSARQLHSSYFMYLIHIFSSWTSSPPSSI